MAVFAAWRNLVGGGGGQVPYPALPCHAMGWGGGDVVAHKPTTHSAPVARSRCSIGQATRAYLHAEADVEAALEKHGFKVVKREMTATSFYFSRLLEAVRA